jgi:hypothetical protein
VKLKRKLGIKTFFLKITVMFILNLFFKSQTTVIFKVIKFSSKKIDKNSLKKSQAANICVQKSSKIISPRSVLWQKIQHRNFAEQDGRD